MNSLLVCGSILGSLFTPKQAMAEGLDVTHDTEEDNEDSNAESTEVSTKPMSERLLSTSTSSRSEEFTIDEGNLIAREPDRVFIQNDLTIYYEDPESDDIKGIQSNLLPVGSIADIDETKDLDGVEYHLLSVFGREIGWVKSDAITHTYSSFFSEREDINLEKTYGVANDKAGIRSLPTGVVNSRNLNLDIEEGTVLDVVEVVESVTPVEHDTWYLYKGIDDEGYINRQDLKDYYLFGDRYTEATTRSRGVQVHSQPSFDSDVVVELEGDKQIDLFGKEIVSEENITEQWAKVSTENLVIEGLDSELEHVYMPFESVDLIHYATREETTVIEDLGALSEGSIIYNKPVNERGYEQTGEFTLPESLDTDYLVFVEKEVVIDFMGEESTWYKVNDTKQVGYVPAEVVNLDVERESLQYTINSEDTVEDIIETYGVNGETIYRFNRTVDLDNLVEGETLWLNRPEITFDTEKVAFVNDSTSELIRELADSVYDITDAGLYPSVAIAQAILESGGGTSGLSKTNHNLFGIKGTYNGQGSSWETWEDYGNGSVTINATFRAYPSKNESILDYINLITTNGRYERAVNAESATASIQAIKDGGYATDPHYVSKILNIINLYDLTQFDVMVNN